MFRHTHPRLLTILIAALAVLLCALPAVAGDAAPGKSAKDCKKTITTPDGKTVELDGMMGSFGFLGVEMTALSPELRTHFGVPGDAGVMISRVVEDSPAAKAGIEVGDIITRADGDDIRSANQLGRVVRRFGDGEAMQVEYWRDGKVATATAYIAERCSYDISHMISKDFTLDLEGIESLQGLAGLEGLKALEEIDFGEIGKITSEALKGIDWSMIGSVTGEAMEEAMAKVHEAMENEDWEAHFQAMKEINTEEIEARMEELQKRLEQLEVELEEKTKTIEERDDL